MSKPLDLPRDRDRHTGRSLVPVVWKPVSKFAGALTPTTSAARLREAFARNPDADRARSGAHRLFRVLDEHLWFAEQEGRNWLCGPGHPTIADIACFPGVMLSEEGGISRMPYPAIRRWTDRVKRIPGFVPMPGIFPV